MRSILHRLDHEEGAISIMAAVLAVVLILSTALAVDVGRMAYTSRDQQGFTDRLVMDGMIVLQEAGEDATPEELYAAVQAAALDTESVNIEGSALGTSQDRTITNIQLGWIDPAEQEFKVVYDKDGQGPYYGLAPVTALKILTDSYVDFLFAVFDDEGGRTVAKEALGSIRYQICEPPDECRDPFAEALVSVRSRVAAFSTNRGVYQQYVEDTLGLSAGSLNATFIGYDGLATSFVELNDFADAGATVGTVDEFLNSSVQVRDLLTAMASGLRNDDAATRAAAAATLNGMATALNSSVDPALSVKLGDFLGATTEDLDALLRAEMDAHTLLSAVTMAAAIADGNNAVRLTLTGSNLLGLTGLTSFTADLSLVEPPRFEWGRASFDGEAGEWITQAETAQVSLNLSVTANRYYSSALLDKIVHPDLLAGLLCLLGPTLCPSTTVSLQVGAAEATAALTQISCGDPESATVTDLVTSSDAVVATASGLNQTIFTSRNGTLNYGVEGELVRITSVPGVGASSDVSITGGSVLDGLIEPILGFVGADIGTAEAQVHEVNCGYRQLITLLPE